MSMLLLTHCTSKKESKTTTEIDMQELIFSEKIENLIKNQEQYKSLNSLVLDVNVSCEELQSLCESKLANQLTYLLFYDLDCNHVTADFKQFNHLEKLIVNSSTLDHLPEAFLDLPRLKHLQLDLMEYNTYEGPIPTSCQLEEIEFQTTPVESLGNLSQIPSLHSVGIIDNEKIKNDNEKIKVVYH